MSDPDDLDQMSETELLKEAVREMRRTRKRLDEGQEWMETAQEWMKRYEAEHVLTLRACQTLLLAKATSRQLLTSLRDITEALERAERDEENADTVPPSAPDDTRPDHPRPTMPAEAPVDDAQG